MYLTVSDPPLARYLHSRKLLTNLRLLALSPRSDAPSMRSCHQAMMWLCRRRHCPTWPGPTLFLARQYSNNTSPYFPTPQTCGLMAIVSLSVIKRSIPLHALHSSSLPSSSAKRSLGLVLTFFSQLFSLQSASKRRHVLQIVASGFSVCGCGRCCACAIQQ